MVRFMFVHLSDTYSVSIEDIVAIVQDIPLLKGRRRRNKQWQNKDVIHVFPDEPIESYLVTVDTVYGLSMSISGVGRRLQRAAMGIPVNLYIKR